MTRGDFQGLLRRMSKDKITVSTVAIGSDADVQLMVDIAKWGRGRFYYTEDSQTIPRIFTLETQLASKASLVEQPFKPQLTAQNHEAVQEIDWKQVPPLGGYVATTVKANAELVLMSHQEDPVLATWRYGLGRAVAFTSDAKAKWAQDWLGWPKYRQFWSQIAKWSLRRLDNADFTTDVTIDKGEGVISVEALDEKGNYRNFLNLQSVIVSPKGERQAVRLEQTGPGHYEARFPTKAVGAYSLILTDIANGEVRGTQRLGASVNYSPEFNATEPNLNLLRRLAEAGGGKVLDPDTPADNPFLHGRVRTFQPRDLWEWLLKLAIIMFPLDVGVRRIQIDRAERLKATQTLRRWLFFWRGVPRTPESRGSRCSRCGNLCLLTIRRSNALFPDAVSHSHCLSTSTGGGTHREESSRGIERAGDPHTS